MDSCLLSLGRLDCAVGEHLGDAFRQFDAILGPIREDLRLEEDVQRRKERLRVLESPPRGVYLRLPGDFERDGEGAKLFSHCVPPRSLLCVLNERDGFPCEKNKMNFQLRKFDINMIKERCEIDSRKSPMMVIIGKKDTGKSFLVRDILFNTQSCFPVGTVISATEVANEFFQHMVPSKFIHDKYRPEIVQNVIKRQATIKDKRNKDKNARGGSSSIDPRAFLILDDCLYDNTWIQQDSTRYVFMNGRHVDLTTMITMQYPLGITPNLRTNVDFVFILRENILGNRRRIYENYAGMFPTFEMFCQFMDQCTENYECLVICNNVSSNRLEDQVFWYKASDHPPFKLCDQSLWLDNRPFQSAMLAGDEYNPANVQKKGPSVWVKKTGEK
jgi:hypothetical protein